MALQPITPRTAFTSYGTKEHAYGYLLANHEHHLTKVCKLQNAVVIRVEACEQ